MIKLTLNCLLYLSFLLIHGIALAQEMPAKKIEFRVPWVLTPQSPDQTTVQLKEGQTVTSARLVPAQSLIMDSDLKSSDGRLLLEAGAEMTRTTATEFLACSVSSLDVGVLEAFLFTASRYVCAIDYNSDGKFDKYFFEGSGIGGLLIGKGKTPRKLDLLGENRYRSGSAAHTTTPSLELRYTNFAFISGWALFELCIKVPDKRCEFLDGKYGVKVKDLPSRFEVLGGIFEVTEKNDAGLKVRMNRPFSLTPMMFDN